MEGATAPASSCRFPENVAYDNLGLVSQGHFGKILIPDSNLDSWKRIAQKVENLCLEEESGSSLKSDPFDTLILGKD
eukprot:jgi/Bigna1/130361/aug1.11_g5069